MLLHHATGFTGMVWNHLATSLASKCHVFAFDARGHGESPPHGGADLSWESYGSDLCYLAGALSLRLGLESIRFGVGHSLGGVAMNIAAGSRPGIFQNLCLVEPVILPPGSESGRTRFSVQARMRRNEFTSRAEAHRTLAQLPQYREWHPDIFEDYLNSALRPVGQGRLELACDPAVEARIYELGATPGYLGGAGRPALSILAAKESRFCADLEKLVGGGHGVSVDVVEGRHLLPMEEPAVLQNWLLGQIATAMGE